MKKLIINADDFGIHEAVNRGIIEGHEKGSITSTSLMAVGKAFDNALQLAAKAPHLGIGVHLTLVGEKPLCDPCTVPSLTDREGCFAKEYPLFIKRYFSGSIDLIDVRRELYAQVAKIIEHGIQVSHIDSHQHLHVLPRITDIVVEIAKEFNIKALRIPHESYTFTGGYPFQIFRLSARAGLSFLATIARRKAQKAGLQVPDHFFGMLAGGNMHEKYLLAIIKQLPEGSSEIMLHPGQDDILLKQAYGWPYNWQSELAAVTGENLKKLVKEREISLISFKELAYA